MSAPHPQHDEVTRLLAHLIAAGFSPVSVDDGDGEIEPTPTTTVDEAVRMICGVDESRLCVSHPSRPVGHFCIFIVLGNGPGELCCDYSNREPLVTCLEAFADAEEARPITPTGDGSPS